MQDVGAGGCRHLERAATSARDVRSDRHQTPGHVRAELPAGPSAGRAGRKFITLFQMGWDHHGDITQRCRRQCADSRPAGAALVKDLKQRGLLDDTLVRVRQRIRPDAVRARRAEGGLWPRPPRRQLHLVDGGRRRQGRVHAMAKPTTSATASRRIRYIFTISTPRCCTSSASITNG